MLVVVKTNGDFYQLKRITMNYASISFQFSVFRGNICTTTGPNNCFILDIKNVNSPITQKNNNKLNCKVQTMRQKLKIFRRINFGLVCKHNYITKVNKYKTCIVAVISDIKLTCDTNKMVCRINMVTFAFT